jgi:hypothetical protein
MKTATHPFQPERGALHVRRQIANGLVIALTTLLQAPPSSFWAI